MEGRERTEVVAVGKRRRNSERGILVESRANEVSEASETWTERGERTNEVDRDPSRVRTRSIREVAQRILRSALVR